MGLIFVDCEAYGGCPATGNLTEFGAVAYPKRDSYHGIVIPYEPDPDNPAIPRPLGPIIPDRLNSKRRYLAKEFAEWITRVSKDSRPIFVSDNPAFDWQWINDLFLTTTGTNPFGHSARRIGDFYAGLSNDFFHKQDWKRLRKTKHDHNPIHDCLGNVEAFEKLMERAKIQYELTAQRIEAIRDSLSAKIG